VETIKYSHIFVIVGKRTQALELCVRSGRRPRGKSSVGRC